ncbi:MAG: TetR/AcrR family transcriptional regulator [Frankiaceae bacterium]|nr:TetR/AcrR family transcriptional regulator [Frankiaceae bacterium]MBV9870895.1 TetR/AcrR family transcriptional regulator [Frankiaceae bacterium]
MRRDAAENRERVLTAAATVFADRGIEASVEEIARAAGVGMGTVYRRFPTKEALITELVRDMLEAMCRMAADATSAGDGRGLERYLETSSAYQAEHRGCLPRLWNIDAHQSAVQRLRRLVTALLDDAKRNGVVRPEVTNTDITMVMWSIRGVIETTADVAPDAWRRHLDVLIAGLRPADRPLRRPALTRQQVDAVLTNT